MKKVKKKRKIEVNTNDSGVLVARTSVDHTQKDANGKTGGLSDLWPGRRFDYDHNVQRKACGRKQS